MQVKRADHRLEAAVIGVSGVLAVISAVALAIIALYSLPQYYLIGASASTAVFTGLFLLGCLSSASKTKNEAKKSDPQVTRDQNLVSGTQKSQETSASSATGATNNAAPLHNKEIEQANQLAQEKKKIDEITDRLSRKITSISSYTMDLGHKKLLADLVLRAESVDSYEILNNLNEDFNEIRDKIDDTTEIERKSLSEDIRSFIFPTSEEDLSNQLSLSKSLYVLEKPDEYEYKVSAAMYKYQVEEVRQKFEQLKRSYSSDTTPSAEVAKIQTTEEQSPPPDTLSFTETSDPILGAEKEGPYLSQNVNDKIQKEKLSDLREKKANIAPTLGSKDQRQETLKSNVKDLNILSAEIDNEISDTRIDLINRVNKLFNGSTKDIKGLKKEFEGKLFQKNDLGQFQYQTDEIRKEIELERVLLKIKNNSSKRAEKKSSLKRAVTHSSLNAEQEERDAAAKKIYKFSLQISDQKQKEKLGELKRNIHKRIEQERVRGYAFTLEEIDQKFDEIKKGGNLSSTT